MILGSIAWLVPVLMTLWLILVHLRNGINEKFPCIVVKTRHNHDTKVSEEKSEEEKSQRPWEIRLVNIGRGPAFIQDVVTEGLTRGERPDVWFDYPNGRVPRKKMDRVIGPEIGDPHLQVHFAYGDTDFLRSDGVSVCIIYNDIAGRMFRSGIVKGNPIWEPPPEFSHTKFSLWLRKLAQVISSSQCAPRALSRWLNDLLKRFYKEFEAPSDEVKALRDFLEKYPPEKGLQQ